MNFKALNLMAVFVIIVLIGYLLIVGRHFLLPLVIAIVLWYLISGVTHLFLKIPFGNWHLSYGLALILALAVCGGFLYCFFSLLAYNFANVLVESAQYQEKLKNILLFFDQYTGSHFNVRDTLTQVNLTNLFSQIALMLSSLTSNLVLILLYVLMLLLEHQSFPSKLAAICVTHEKHQKVQQVLTQISQDINQYLRIKTAMSILTGVLSYIILIAFGCRNAIFWATVIAILNYIPTIGTIVAVGLTLLAVSIEFSTWGLFVLMAGCLIAVQFIVGNIIEPKFMGRRLNLSPFIIILSLAFWGAIWGVLGMILCVPVMTILNIILAKFERTRPFAALLSANNKY